MPPSRPLYVVGDAHGDAHRLVSLLSRHGLVVVHAGEVRWLKRGVVLLFMGDLLDAKSRVDQDDSFQDTLSDMWILEFLGAIAREAQKHDSTVLALLGNHELMNLRSMFDYVSPFHAHDLDVRRSYFAEGGAGRETLQTIFHTSLVYNGNHYSHAGIPIQATPAQMKMLGKRVSPALISMAETPELEHLLSHRDYFDRESAEVARAARAVCDRNGIRRMVIGHNCTMGEGVVEIGGGALVFADVGLSRAFTPYQSAAALEMVLDPGDGNLAVLKPDGSRVALSSR